MMYLNSDFDVKKSAKLLVKYGFVKDSAKSKYADYYAEKDPKKKVELFTQFSEDDFVADADMEKAEITNKQMANTSYPSPNKRHLFGIQDPNKGILENVYFWMLGHMSETWGYNKVIKVTDSFAGSAQSSFFGASSQRLSILQDRVSNTLQTIGMLVKDMFPQIHELHIWDERIGWYERVKKKDKAADITLKGTWIDLVEGGTENAGSVYGLAAKVGFSILPDLFFNTFVLDSSKVDETVDKLKADGYNKEVRNILKRKLFQYTRWREESEREVQTRKRFIIRYLRQHFNTLKMYMGWIRPYLKQLKFMQQNADFNDRPEMINGFETAIMEIEIIATKMTGKKYLPVGLFNFYYTTKPEMNITDPSYQHRGPMHAGEIYVTMRSYAWTQDQIDNYKKMRNEEDMDFLSEVDGGLKASIDQMSEELVKYMDEIDVTLLSEEQIRAETAKKNAAEELKKADKAKMGDVFEPFTGVFKGFGEMFSPLIPSALKGMGKKDKTPYQVAYKNKEAKASAKKDANMILKMCFKNYRKAHKMVTW